MNFTFLFVLNNQVTGGRDLYARNWQTQIQPEWVKCINIYRFPMNTLFTDDCGNTLNKIPMGLTFMVSGPGSVPSPPRRSIRGLLDPR